MFTFIPNIKIIIVITMHISIGGAFVSLELVALIYILLLSFTNQVYNNTLLLAFNSLGAQCKTLTTIGSIRQTESTTNLVVK